MLCADDKLEQTAGLLEGYINAALYVWVVQSVW